MKQTFLHRMKLKDLRCANCNKACAQGLWSISDSVAEATVPLCDDCADLDLTDVFFNSKSSQTCEEILDNDNLL